MAGGRSLTNASLRVKNYRSIHAPEHRRIILDAQEQAINLSLPRAIFFPHFAPTVTE